MLEGKIQRLKRVEFGHKKGLFLSLGKEVGGGALKITVLTTNMLSENYRGVLSQVNVWTEKIWILDN